MRVLVITGDPSFKPGNRRFDIQAQATSELVPMYFGRQSLFPKMPQGVYDVVTTQDPFWRGLFALYVARKKKARFNVQLHADFEAQHTLKKIIGRFVLKQADSIRVVSEKLKTQVIKLGAVAPITVLPVFVDIAPYVNIVRTPSSEMNMLWVGRFEKEKDPLKAIETLKEVRAQGIQVKLVMLGSGTLEEQLRIAAKGLPVEFPGWQDPKEYLAKASLVLSTSPAESWGMSIVEALAAHVPVISFDVGIAREAGAIIAKPEELVDTVVSTLQLSPPAILGIELFSEKQWVTKWVTSLV